MRFQLQLVRACALLCALAIFSMPAAAVDCPMGGCPLPVGQMPAGQLPTGQMPASAMPVVPADVQVDARPIARIENTLSASRSFGSGTLIDVDERQGLVVTCAHLFREGTGTILVRFPGSAAYGGRLAKLDSRADLAAIVIQPPAIQPVELSAQYPQPGDPLTSCGYGSDGTLWCNHGQALGYVALRGGYGRETLELSGSARLGDSGGPVLDGTGHLAGVLYGTNGRVVDATYCGRVRQFLQGLAARFSDSAPAPIVTAEPPPALEAVPPRPARLGRPQRKKAPAAEPPESDPLDKAADALGSAVQPWLSAKATALLIGLGVPGGIAGLAGGAIVWLVMRRGKKRLQSEIERLQGRGHKNDSPTAATAAATSDKTTTQTSASNQPNAAQEKGVQQKIIERHHNQYVAYEVGDVDKAWAGAHARVSEKYPGAVPYLKIVEGVKNQLLSGIDEPQFS